MPQGLLVNQIGSDPRFPLRWVFRGDSRNDLPPEPVCSLQSADGNPLAQTTGRFWGELWGAFWWVGEFSPPGEGTFRIRITDTQGRDWSQPADVLARPYFTRSFEHVALGQFERRHMIPTAPGHGWIDCGAHLSEANSHAVALFGMTEVFRERGDELSASQRARLLEQIRIGAEFFLFLAGEAKRRGMPAGTYQHEPVGPSTWIAQDALQAGVALCRAAPVLAENGHRPMAEAVVANARANFDFLNRDPETVMREMIAQLPQPPPDTGVQLRTFSRHTHALDTDRPPPTAWMTRELLLFLQFQLELEPLIGEDLTALQQSTVEAVLARWTDADEGETPAGFFLPFPDTDQPEVAWCHHSVGRDTGGVFPHYVLPLLQYAKRRPDSPLAARCRETVRRFVDGYLAPAGKANPFGLLPNTWKRHQGWLHFAGLWHGMNSSYALMAMQSFVLAREFELPWLEAFGRAQMDWIAGLNCGLTDEAQYGCFMTHRDVPSGVALPVSMIYGVGRDWAGNWRTIRGSICNGFSRGRQFHFDAEPDLAEDRPDALTDEDWITHGGAWLAALAHSNL